MKRRTFLQMGVTAVAARSVQIDAQAPLTADALATLREVAAVVLPSELGRKGSDEAVDRFDRWLRGYKASAEMDPGYGFTRVRATGPFPGGKYGAQLAALTADAQKRGGRLNALAPDAQRAVIESALANASHDLEVKLNDLVVAHARVDGGPLLNKRKRFMARAMGRAFPIRKRTCHISVVLAEGAPKAKRAGKREPAGAQAPPAPAPTPTPTVTKKEG